MEAARHGPRQRRKEARPGEILDAAFEEFARRGYAATRLDDVAARAGITKGTIYVYFPSKEDLFVATFKEMVRPTMENIAALTHAPQGTAMDILRAHFRFVYDHMVADRRGRELLRLLMAEAGRFPSLAERWHDEVIGPAVERMRAVMRYGVARGEFRPGVEEAYPHLLFSPVMMASTWLSLFGEAHPLELQGYYAAHLDMMRRALCIAA
ncbi:transcriptional regulator, TetR family [Methylobacterium sp. 4-46]|uniref:TetR/AcrR family transcriptional regulator n=1 Tax=unclassified Methylobacterium TaxID=2615210 RepID=UPI000152D1CB|nr:MULTISPECIES: TetR/AcrR family transcriptional regulator [Methylobacterium]ACA15626.1 transcriptional regulator, TetR family [Methylobacterium sp. 4-46]WFT81340.1 TetR/AcrR family transcriptional regulator [Methylobacterium nodulans]